MRLASIARTLANSFIFVGVLVFSSCGEQGPGSSPALEGKESRLHYVGKNSTEATMSFDHRVLIPSRKDPGLHLAKQRIEDQLAHLFGPLSAAEAPAVPKGDHKITQVELQESSDRPGFWTASYHYEGTIVLRTGPRTTYNIILPIDPSAIYSAGIVRRGDTEKYPCTDSHYNSEGDFWYFWNPAREDCPLQAGVDYDVVKTQIERVKNSRKSYPDYSRLVDAEGTLPIHILMGMDEPREKRNPLQSSDLNAANYRQIRTTLLAEGYTARQWTPEEIRQIAGKKVRSLPFVEEFTKEQKGVRLVIRVFFGPSGIDENSRAFHYFFKDALENAAVMIYDGHSGLGGHLDLASIEENEEFRIQPPRGRYQIYFFNSCSSYTYYNSMFFDRKSSRRDPDGTLDLDILTNGLATYFHVTHDANMALIKAIDDWAAGKAGLSYQELSKIADSSNLFGINGDEDNPTAPPRRP